MDFLHQQESKYPALKARYEKMGNLFTKKLYHELTLELNDFVHDAKCNQSDNWIQLYSHFIKPMMSKLNQLKVVQIAIQISTQFKDKKEQLAFLEGLEGKDQIVEKESILVCEMAIAVTKLAIGKQFHADVKKLLEDRKETIESLVGAEPIIHSYYYRAACTYYLAEGPAHLFYKSALMLLAYSNYEEMEPSERFALATNISLAALTGEGVYNFGEVLATPILKALKGTDKEWLSDLLHAFNKGDIDKYNEIVGAHRAEFDSQPALINKRDYVKEKVAILALIELIFHCPAHERNLPFTKIAEAARLPVEQVEWLVMRALSLGLIKGHLDQVDQIVYITWVQPRVLDNDQLKQLKGRFEDWQTKTKDMLLFVEDQTPELFQ